VVSAGCARLVLESRIPGVVKHIVTSVVGFLRLRTERECRDWEGLMRSVLNVDTTAVFAAALLLGKLPVVSVQQVVEMIELLNRKVTKLYNGGAHCVARATL
jgi:hypothetical protein